MNIIQQLKKSHTTCYAIYDKILLTKLHVKNTYVPKYDIKSETGSHEKGFL